LESGSDDAFSWDGADSSSEEEIGCSSNDDDPMAGNAFRFLGSSKEDSKEENDGSGGYTSDDDGSGDSSADESGWSDDDGDDGDVPARSPKHRRYLRAVDVGSIL